MHITPNVRVKDFLKISKRKTHCAIMPYVGCGLYTTPGDSTVIINPDGVNYSFRDIDFPSQDVVLFLKDEDGWLYQFNIFGPDDSEVFGLYDGLDPAFVPVITYDPPATSNNYEFSADGFLRWRNEDFNVWHYIVSDNQNIGIETPGELANPAGAFYLIGNLFKFENSVLYIYDTPNATWRAPLVIADINHQNAIIQLT